jgi:hypothetical protein
VFVFIVDHKLSVVKVVLGLMRDIWSKVLGFMIIISQKHIMFMQFFFKKNGEGFSLGFFWSNHQTGMVFKTIWFL